jgi:hypothetical protein
MVSRNRDLSNKHWRFIMNEYAKQGKEFFELLVKRGGLIFALHTENVVSLSKELDLNTQWIYKCINEWIESGNDSIEDFINDSNEEVK